MTLETDSLVDINIKFFPAPVRKTQSNEPDISFLAEVKQAILKGLAIRDVNQKTVASFLGLTVRTLQRRLKGQSTTYTSVLDETRVERLEGMLREGDTIGSAAEKLCFKNRSSLNRLLERQRAMFPKEFRKVQKLCAAFDAN